MRFTAADVLTFSRIALALLLLFFRTFSVGFFAVYIIGGLTDVLDGAVARKTGTESKAGSRLDTLADIVFAASVFVKVVPELNIPSWLWVWICAIIAIKAFNILVGFVSGKGFVSDHSWINKVAGFIVFLFPLTIPFIDYRYTVIAVCAVATVAAVMELYHVITRNKDGASGQ